MKGRQGRARARAVLPAVTFLGGLAVFASGGATNVRADDLKGTSRVLAESGRADFQRYCASCHGASALGDGPVATELRKVPPDLTRTAARHGGTFPAADVAAVIDGRFEMPVHGTREMPIWGTRLGENIPELSTQDEVARGRIDALVAYLQTLQR